MMLLALRRLLAPIAMLLAGLSNAPVLAGGGPENVLVVVNVNSPDSLAVANTFVHLRDIPPQNVVYLDRVPDAQACGVGAFREHVLHPVLEAIEERKLGQQIDYIVYSAGFPTAVEISNHLEQLTEHRTDLDRRLFGPRASINALTYFYGEVSQDSASFMFLDANWYKRRVVRDFLDRPFVGELQEKFQAAIESCQSGDYRQARSQLAEIVQQHPGQVAARYWLVRALAGEEKTDLALRQLNLCVATGWCYRTFTKNDETLDNLHDDPRFSEIIERAPNKLFGDLPTRGFSNQQVWSVNGWPNGDPSQGKRFVLSTVLAVTRGRGTTLQQALDQIATSVAADFTQPQGTFYFTRTSDVRTRTRRGQFARAISELEGMGFGAQEINSVLPAGRTDVLGATIGAAAVNWDDSGNRFLPGAICDNLTSYGGVMRANASQTPLTNFIAAGAAGASGTVVEPLSVPQKFPEAMLHVHYTRGCSLAEAFYQSVAGPFQLLIVGDPLCRPWAVPPRFEIAGLPDDQTVQGEIELTLTPDEDSPPISRFELFVDGVRRAVAPPSRTIKFDSSRMTDGFHQLRLVAVDATPIGTRFHQSLGFHVDNQGDSVQLDIEGNGAYQLGRTLLINVAATCGESIEIVQNSRVVARIEGREGQLRIDCEQLGQGPTTLRAVVKLDDQRQVASLPVQLEIIP